MKRKQFRDYQLAASDAICSTWNKHKSGICVVATGGGKTVIAAGTTAKIHHKGRVLFLANRNELCTQPLATFADQLGFEPALEKAEFRAPLDAQVVVGSVQTLSRQKRLDRFPKDHFGYIFADECHMAAAPSWKRIFDYFDGAKLCGITATPFRSDAKSLVEIFETESFRKDLFALVDEGWLVDPDHVDKLSTAISLAQVRVKRNADGEKDFDVNDAADAIAPYFDEIAKEIAERHADRHILAFLPLVASSQKFVAACKAAGINAVHVDGEDPERDTKLKAFRDGQIALLSNSNLLHTGVDIPICDATLNLRPTKSKVLYAQIVGRSTRTVPGLVDDIPDAIGRLQAIARSSKPRAYIIDPLWLSAEHDLVTPSFMIAPDQDFAVEMNRAAGKSYSLRVLRSVVQEQREAAIRRRLSDVARFRDGKVNADWFAASIQDHELVNYQPVYQWETKPTVRFSRLLLEQAGIDPDSVGSEGKARQVLRAVNKRRYKKLAEIRALAPFVRESTGISDNLWLLTQREAAEKAATLV
jgi:superfamily II DNA or RNA helicase